MPAAVPVLKVMVLAAAELAVSMCNYCYACLCCSKSASQRSCFSNHGTSSLQPQQAAAVFAQKERKSTHTRPFQVTVDLTEAQIQDLLYLRRLFCGKIGQLSRSRKELMSKLPSDSIGICHASDKLEEVTNLAEQLRANGSEEYRTYMQFASSFYRGVSLPCSYYTWAALYNTWLLIKMTPKGVVFSFLVFSKPAMGLDVVLQ